MWNSDKCKNILEARHSVSHVYAVSTQAPPIALIPSSANLEKSLAFTMIGIFGNSPFPSTLKNPYTLIKSLNTALVQSMTTALALSPSFVTRSFALS